MDKLALAKLHFYEQSYSNAREIFLELQMLYEVGLCTLLMDKPKDAYKIWKSIKEPDIATRWGMIVYDFIHLKWNYTPSFFQVRAFLEVYLNLFIENKLFKYAENLISAQNILAKSNLETYKFISRVLFTHGYFNILPDFINRSKQCCYLDPEIHFIEAQMHYKMRDFPNALTSLGATLQIVPDYFPALSLKEEILSLQ